MTEHNGLSHDLDLRTRPPAFPPGSGPALAREGWTRDLAYGNMMEGCLGRLLADEGLRVEVKADEQVADTGNLYVELHNRGLPSGLLTSCAEWWAFNLDHYGWLIITSERLQALVARAIRERRTTRGGDGGRTDGVLIPVVWFVQAHAEKYQGGRT